MRLTNRDIQVIEFLKEFRVASTSDLMELFEFTQPSCNRRMKQLMEEFRYIKKIEYNPTYNFYNDKYNPDKIKPYKPTFKEDEIDIDPKLEPENEIKIHKVEANIEPNEHKTAWDF